MLHRNRGVIVGASFKSRQDLSINSAHMRVPSLAAEVWASIDLHGMMNRRARGVGPVARGVGRGGR